MPKRVSVSIEPIGLRFDRLGRQVENGHFHAAGDIDADGVGNDGILGGQHAADGQAIADVGVRHERGRDGHGQVAGVIHLLEGFGVEILAPLAEVDGVGARGIAFGGGRGDLVVQGELGRHFAEMRVVAVIFRPLDDGGQCLPDFVGLHPGFLARGRSQPLGQFGQRSGDAEFFELARFHCLIVRA